MKSDTKTIPMRRPLLWASVLILGAGGAVSAQVAPRPVRVHPNNSRYLQGLDGKPVLLVRGGEK